MRVTHPSTDAGTKAGYYPDPLVPRAFGAAVRMPARTAALYVLVHVPYGAKPGAATATLRVENGAESVDLPVRLRVWDFGWKRLSTHTAFALSTNAIKESLRGSVGFSGARKQRLYTAYCHDAPAARRHADAAQRPAARLAAARSTPPTTPPTSRPTRARTASTSPTSRSPGTAGSPRASARALATSSWMRTYLTDVCRVFADNGWQKKAFAFVIDEPTSIAEERDAEKYAQLLHKASAAAGFRCRFLLTDDPRPTSLGGIKTANSFLFDDVDIWCTRYYYFFGRVPALRARRAAGDEIWWYTYANAGADRMPGYLIDKTLADQRVFGWLMHQWDVDGLLNWGTNRWGDALHRQRLARPLPGPRLVPQEGRARGQRRQLPHLPRLLPAATDWTTREAGPVSSLRLEALRDGLEDREYLRLAARTSGGAALAKQVAARIAWYPYPVRQANVFDFPKYTTKPGAFDKARRQLAERIEQSN